MLKDQRIRTLISELDAIQSARARLFLHLSLVADLTDVRGFVESLADVATTRARSRSSKERHEWQRFADELESFLLPPPLPAARKPVRRAQKGREGRQSVARRS